MRQALACNFGLQPHIGISGCTSARSVGEWRLIILHHDTSVVPASRNLKAR
jgi:hypothetical protein